MENRKLFFAVSLAVILAMYIVPYTLLSGIVGGYTFIFWALVSAIYLVFVIFSIRK